MPRSPSSDADFRRIFDDCHEAVHTYCLRRLAIEDANEATAEVFLVVWRRLDQVPPGDEVLLWLYGVARNVVRNYQRGARRYLRLVARVGSVRAPVPEEPAPQVIRSLEQAEVRRALGRLSLQDQELLLLKAWEKLSNKEIGEFLGVSHRAVEGRFARALNRLAKVLPSASTEHHRSPRPVSKGGEW